MTAYWRKPLISWACLTLAFLIGLTAEVWAPSLIASLICTVIGLCIGANGGSSGTWISRTLSLLGFLANVVMALVVIWSMILRSVGPFHTGL